MNDKVKTYFEKNGITLPKQYTIDTSFSAFLWIINAHGLTLSFSQYTKKLYMYPLHPYNEKVRHIANKEIIQIWNDKIIKFENLDKLREKI